MTDYIASLSPVDQGLARYLLADLPESAVDTIGLATLISSKFWQSVLAMEDSLVEAYVDDQLSPRDRVLFEAQFLNVPERAEKIQLARANANRR